MPGEGVNAVQKTDKHDCPCSNSDCPRNTKCEECMAYHTETGSLTACGKNRKDVER